jgi:hypothetical protein
MNEREGRGGLFRLSASEGFSRSSPWLDFGWFGFFGWGPMESLGRSVWFDLLLGIEPWRSGLPVGALIGGSCEPNELRSGGRSMIADRGSETTRRRTSSPFCSGEVARATAESRIRGVRVSIKGTNTGNRLSDRYMNQADIT